MLDTFYFGLMNNESYFIFCELSHLHSLLTLVPLLKALSQERLYKKER